MNKELYDDYAELYRMNKKISQLLQDLSDKILMDMAKANVDSLGHEQGSFFLKSEFDHVYTSETRNLELMLEMRKEDERNSRETAVTKHFVIRFDPKPNFL